MTIELTEQQQQALDAHAEQPARVIDPGTNASFSSVPDLQLAEKGSNMKKARKPKPEPEMLAEYDFSQGVRGKYAKSFAEGTNLVLLDPDLAKIFPDSQAVNEALRTLVRIGRRGDANKKP